MLKSGRKEYCMVEQIDKQPPFFSGFLAMAQKLEIELLFYNSGLVADRGYYPDCDPKLPLVGHRYESMRVGKHYFELSAVRGNLSQEYIQRMAVDGIMVVSPSLTIETVTLCTPTNWLGLVRQATTNNSPSIHSAVNALIDNPLSATGVTPPFANPDIADPTAYFFNMLSVIKPAGSPRHLRARDD